MKWRAAGFSGHVVPRPRDEKLDRCAYIREPVGNLTVEAGEEVRFEGADAGSGVSIGVMIDQSQSRSKGKREPTLDEARLRQQAIGAKLRQMFNDVVNEPVPDEFLEILRQADERKAGDR
jgi:hypothetical protein